MYLIKSLLPLIKLSDISEPLVAASDSCKPWFHILVF